MNALATASSPAFSMQTARELLNVDCLERIISGRPLPDGVQARLTAAPCPPSTSEGIAAILHGPM